MPRYELIIESAYGVQTIQIIEAPSPEAAQKFAEEVADGWSFTVQRIDQVGK